MAELLKGAPVTAALNGETTARASALRARGVAPTLAILRVGARDDDVAYENGAVKRCGAVGVDVRRVTLPADVPADDFYRTLDGLNRDDAVHGILMLRPLPAHIDGERARQMLAVGKDVDGCTDGSLAGVFTRARVGFPPCTAEAVVAVLKHYGVGIAGSRAAVIGRSLVVGRPAAMLLLRDNATVTICHTGTRDLPAVVREADIVVAASGKMESLGADCFRPGQTVVDVGISWNGEKGKLCGDVRFDEAEPIVAAITPVPGGVGTVTSALLAAHAVEAAERAGDTSF